ncbi:MAG: cupin domain-containing protein [Pseudomonadales bacterium]
METTNVLELLAANPEGSFLEFGVFNGKPFGTCDVTGVSPGWEMHPDTDEFFYVIEGTVEITLLEDSGPEHYVAAAGTSFVVPQGIWHKPGAPSGAKFIHFTPGQSLYSESDDPRDDETPPNV